MATNSELPLAYDTASPIQSELVDDSSTPPAYDTASPIQCDQSSVFSSCRMKKKRTAVLSRICDIVLGPDFIPESSVVPNVIICIDALPAALYWAIVNNRPQAFWALHGFISGHYSYVCEIDLHIACIITSNHAIFSQLNFGVWLEYNFVAGGCIWLLHFHMPEPTNGIWRVDIGLCQYSHPARLNAVLVIEAHNRKPGSAAPPEALKIPLSLADTGSVALTHWL
ncbi:uncharacterized protein F5147DRAFT_658371 [Suillus discolor]|uniref:Uncharacterized protein n=1 Tax=Suillus discolor TaxID=1912936 RepID=A0A9P7JMG6_9AGAM|nr:uncharacterized protein F5147DRAFT_658371 [Suillus discolor]KAG2089616.1 hypothetical protein F5147DRAFT_658371 [Suillus discolor]